MDRIEYRRWPRFDPVGLNGKTLTDLAQAKSEVCSGGAHVVDAEESPVAWLTVPGDDDSSWSDGLRDELDIVGGGLLGQGKTVDGCIME